MTTQPPLQRRLTQVDAPTVGHRASPTQPESSTDKAAVIPQPCSPQQERSTPKETTSLTTRLRILVWVDVGVILLALVIGTALSWGGQEFQESMGARVFESMLLVTLWPALLWKLQSRQASVLGDGPEEYRRVLMAGIWTAVLAAAAAFLAGVTLGRGFLVGVVALGTALLLISRHLMRRSMRRQLRKGASLHSVYVIGNAEANALIVKELAGTAGLFKPVGLWDVSNEPDAVPADIVRRAELSGADTLMYSPAIHSDPAWSRRLAWELEQTDLELFIAPTLSQIAEPRLSIQPVEGLPLVRVEMPRFSGPARVVKRMIDFVGAISILALMAIPLALVAAVIRIDSSGKALFTQIRVGRDGARFKCYKFRTMRQGADRERAALRDEQDGDSATFKMTSDPRITRVGGFLRRFSVDEMPQLFNVIKGEMSLVGPRPHPLDDVELYDADAHRRHLAKPGMTGLWQVSGRSDLDWNDAVALDLYYVDNWSLSMDFLIALRTLKAVVKGSGAY